MEATRETVGETRAQRADSRAPESGLRRPTLAWLARRGGGARGGGEVALARALAAGVALSNRAVARRLQRQADGYGYQFSDDPLNAGGFGPGDAALAVRPGPVRTTLIRPRTPGDPNGYPVPWKAAHAALQIANPKSILSKDPNNLLDFGVEFGGLIYKLGERYFFTEAIQGQGGPDKSPSVDPWLALPRVPAEAQRAIVGDYHTHGGPNQIGEGEDFSGQHATTDILGNVTTGDEQKAGDIWEGREDLTTHAANILDRETYTLFLGTPSGRFAIYIPAKHYVFSFSPDERLLPRGQRVPPSSYAH
jgi:hypothetical protein